MLIQVRELQEIPAAELHQFAIKFVLRVRKKMVNTLVYIIKTNLLDGLKNNILLTRCACCCRASAGSTHILERFEIFWFDGSMVQSASA